MNLNNDAVYYGREAGMRWLSVSQYKSFLSCEAKALAQLKGEWKEVDTDAFLLGNYVHSAFESDEAHEKFLETNKDKLYSSRKPYGLLRKFKIGDQMIERLKEKDFVRMLWQGEHEVPVTGDLYGYGWKGKIDLLNVDQGYFIDLKTTADAHKRIWDNDNRQWQDFVHAYGYDLQLAVYEKLLQQKYGKSFTGYIIAVSKEGNPEVIPITVSESDKAEALQRMSTKIDRVMAVKNGEVEPIRCERCEYCKPTSQPDHFVNANDLID